MPRFQGNWVNCWIAVPWAVLAVVTASSSQALRADDPNDPQATRVKVSFENLFPAQQLLGTPVADPEGKLLGLVRDLLINTETGAVPFAVISPDGTTTQPMHVLPLSAGTIEDFGTQNRLAWRLEESESSALQQTQLSADEDAYSVEQAQQWLAKFGQEAQSRKDDGSSAVGELVSLRGLLWQQITDKDDQPVGVISDFAVDADQSVVAYTVLSLGGTDAQIATDEASQKKLESAPRIAVPLAAYVATPKPRTWKLELPRQEIEAFEPISTADWPREIARSWIEYVSVRYGGDVSGGIQKRPHEEQSHSKE